MIEKLPLVLRALWYGQKLKRSAAWKDVAAAASACAPLLLWAMPWLQARGYLPADMTPEEAQALALQIATAALLGAAYFFRATSDRVGFGNREATKPPPPLDEDPPDVPPVDFPRPVGVLYQVGRHGLQAGSASAAHPGDAPGLDSFNR